MGSSSDSAPNPANLSMGATPTPGLPVAGQGGGTGSDPFSYGKYQSFLPDITGEGPNPMATGLKPEMFDYKSPGGAPPPVLGGGEAPGAPNPLRDMLAKMKVGGGGAPPNY